MSECEEKFKNVYSRTASRLDLATGELSKVAYV